VATEREISRIRHDQVEWRGLVRRLLGYAEKHDLEHRHMGLLESLNDRFYQDELSYRQAEWLLDIRDDTNFVSEYRGASLKFLLRSAFENRFGLDDEDDVAWVEELWRRQEATLRKRDVRKLHALVSALGLFDD
jgi:hypothetical protein